MQLDSIAALVETLRDSGFLSFLSLFSSAISPLFLSLFLFFSPGKARFGNSVRATRTVVNDIESAARAETGSSRQRQDKRQVISLFTT